MTNFTVWAEQLEKNWGVLSQTGVWVLGIVSGFIFDPPDTSNSWKGLARFVVAILTAMVFIAAQKWKRKSHLGIWVAVTCLLLLILVVVFTIYQNRLNNWTCEWNSKHFVIGSEWTVQGAKWQNESCEDLLQDFLGKTDDIWKIGSINRRRTELSLFYFSAVLLCSACLLAAIQSVQIVQQNR